ncbi:MAG: ZrgA family zinc uptake protein, partial [Thiolinea sp.]
MKHLHSQIRKSQTCTVRITTAMHMKTHHFIQKLTPLATALLLALSSYSAVAEKKDNHEMEHHDSHEHGVARLTVATTDDGLEIALESPAANVFGFEHSAKSEEEREAVHAAMDKLKDGSALFAINSAAACSLEKATIEASAADDHE